MTDSVPANSNDSVTFALGQFVSPAGIRIFGGADLMEGRAGIACVDRSGQAVLAELSPAQMRQLATVLNQAAALVENESK